MQLVDRIAEAVLYEGYLLFPYRRSTMKNQQRWTFGGVYPRRFSDAGGGDDPWVMQTQCLVLGDDDTRIDVTVRFLQVADRAVAQRARDSLSLVESLRVGDQVHRPWEEAIERSFPIRDALGNPSLRIGELRKSGRSMVVSIAEGSDSAPLRDAAGGEVGALIRSWQSLLGTVKVSAETVPAVDGEALSTQGTYRVTVRIANTTPWLPASDTRQSRPAALRQTFVSTHTILHVEGGEFVSLLEPPDQHQDAAAACRNIGAWPVLIGDSGERHTLLSSPIILYDYPRIAPESPGNLFEATEIDELLTLSILTLSDDEKREMRESDPRSREILERTESLTPEELMGMHGAIRGMQAIRPDR
jgi:hypothetical protein